MPFIKPQSIDNLLDKADLLEIVSEYCEFKKEGASYKACCPIHNEKSPSFVVTPFKNLVYCFGCGFSAVGPVNFLMKIEKIEYIDALELLAQKCNFILEYESFDDPNAAEKAKIKRKQKNNAYSLVKAAAVKYSEQLQNLSEFNAIWQELIQKRAISKETVYTFEIGYAPENARFITNQVIEKGLFDDANAAGIVNINDNGSKHDVFINRIIFPIYNFRGSIVGFGGQNMGDEKFPKYKNSPGSVIWNKKNNLFGIHLAMKAIRNMGYALVTEGYYDVISTYDKGFHNVVGTCGTSFSSEHADLLKKFTNKICFAFDGDKAGTKALIRSLKISISKGFDTQCLLLHEGADLDDTSRMFGASEFIEFIDKGRGDALFWYANHLIEQVKSAIDKHEATESLASIVATISLPIAKSYYEKELCKRLGSDVRITDFKELVKKQIESAIHKTRKVDDTFELNLPKHVNKNEWIKHGFYELTEKNKAGYYFHNNYGTHTQQSNFIIIPLFHIYSPKDNKRLIEIDNGSNKNIMEMPSQSMTRVDSFASAVYDEGHYLFYGSKVHLMKILNKISANFPLCYELKILGWQQEGFFAYSNAVWFNEIEPMDEYGIVRINNDNYFSPSVSKIYKNLRKDDDEFENDRFLAYKKSSISLAEWSALICKVYPKKYQYVFGFVCIALFRDVVFKLDNNCPLLYSYGKKGSGKTKLSESISAFFFNDLKGFNLNHGTDFAFANRLTRFRNCVVLFEEFDDNTIKPDRFQSLKGAYDGTGRERGRGGRKDRSEMMHINSSPVLTGQYLSTTDDNALLSRCITLEFKAVNNELRSKEQIIAYDNLKELEKQGTIPGLIPELLKYRTQLEKNYPSIFAEVYGEFRDYLLAKKENFQERILRNYCAVATMLHFFNNKVAFGIDGELSALKLSILKDVSKLSNLIDESDALGNYWTIIEQLFEKGDIKMGKHFRIIEESSFKFQINSKRVEEIHFGYTKKLLLLRTKAIHGFYSEAAVRQKQTPLNLSTLKTYLDGTIAWLGNCKSYKFRNDNNNEINTSCAVFDYLKLEDKLNLNSGDLVR